MTQPIGGYGRNAYDYIQAEQSEASSPGLDFCRNARTVTAGALCDEPTVVSDACRSPTNDVDRFLCDDKRMAAAEQSVWQAVKETAKMALQALIGRGGELTFTWAAGAEH